MYALHHEPGVFRGNRRQDAMSQVENMTGATGVFFQNPLDFALDNFPGCVQHGRIKIALHRHLRADQIPGRSQIHVPVETHDVAAGFLDGIQHGSGSL